MSITGLPLITLTLFATGAVAAGTLLLWYRFGRWRLVSRAVGVLLAEVLTVLSIGLVANRLDGFYPSWQALTGDTGTAVVTATQKAGRLDRTVHSPRAAALPWHAYGSAAWRLAGPPTVILPSGYVARTSVSYPAVLDLVDPGPDGAAAVRAAMRMSTITVVAVPTAATTASALTTLPGQLCRDARATTHGWAIVATPRQAGLAQRIIAALPGRFSSLALVGRAAVHVPPGVEVAIASTAPTTVRHGSTNTRLGNGVTALTSTVPWLWHTAAGWAAGQTSLPLAAPKLLPTSTRTGRA